MSQPLSGPFELYSDNHGLYDYMADGGEHTVYRCAYLSSDMEVSALASPQVAPVPEGMILKFSLIALMECGNIKNHKKALAMAGEMAEARNQRYKILQAAFLGHVALQHCVPRLVLLSDDTIARVWGDRDPPERRTCATVATYQQYIPDLQEPPDQRKTFSFHLPYAEYDAPVDESTYAAINQRWLVRPDTPPTGQEINDFLSLHKYPPLKQFIYTKKTLLLVGLGDFIISAIGYSQQTREILDLVGPDNIIFDNNGDHLLIDALFPSSCRHLDKVPSIVMKTQEGVGLTHRDKITLLNGLGYMRTMNFLAALLELPGKPRIDSLFGLDIAPATWRAVYANLASLPRPSELHGPTQPWYPSNYS